jgi:SAM-dependent methyltransferase
MIYGLESFRPDPENMQCIRDAGDSILAEISDNVWAERYIAGNSVRVSYDLDLVKRFASKDSLIVDVGSIPPLLVTALHRQGYRVEGLDLEPERLSSAITKLGITLRQCNVETDRLPYANDSIDLMVLNEVFEHMRIDLIATFTEIRRVLKPGGVILMSTPNGLAMHSIYRMLRHRMIGPSLHFEYEKLTRVGHMGHVREYSVNEVLEFLNQMGFEVPELIWRANYGARWANLCLKAFPKLRPFVSFIIKKPLIG